MFEYEQAAQVLHDKDQGTTEQHERLHTIDTADLPVHIAENIAYGPNGIRGLISSPYIFSASFLASLGGFSFGYDQGVISIINVMPAFHSAFPPTNTGFGKGFMTGMLEFGAFLGCIMFPWLCDRISRKRALVVSVIIFNVGAILQTAAENYAMLVVGRTVGGIGVGTLAMGAPLYISEIAPPNLRGTLLVLESISIVSGVVIAFWITYGTKNMVGEISFRLPLGLQMVCATILGVWINFFPYSPRWLALVHRDEECLQSLKRLRRLPRTDSRINAEHEGIIAEVKFQELMQERNHPGVSGFKLEILSWLDLFNKKTWRRTIVGVGVCFFQQFSGINAFIYYAPTLFESIGQTPEMALILSGIFNCLQLVTVVLCFLIIDKVGRKPLAIIGGFGCAAAFIIIAILSGMYEDDWPSHVTAGWAAVAMAFVFILIFGATYSPLGWAIPPEVFPSALCVTWLSNFIVGVATPPMLESIGFGTYIFFAFWLVLAGVWACVFVVETKGKTLEDMDQAFGDTSGREEKELMRQIALEARTADARETS